MYKSNEPKSFNQLRASFVSDKDDRRYHEQRSGRFQSAPRFIRFRPLPLQVLVG